MQNMPWKQDLFARVEVRNLQPNVRADLMTNLQSLLNANL